MDEHDDGVDYSIFDACKDGHPDDHWKLDPICQAPTLVGPPWQDPHERQVCGRSLSEYPHNDTPEHEPGDKHPFVPLIGPIEWGHGAWRRNDCPAYIDTEWIDGEWTRMERPRKCTCLCHRGTHYVNVYRLDRAYGGPEEGGWYYDCGDPVASVPFDSVREAEAEAGRLEKRFPRGKNRYSVAPQGEDFGVYIEGWFAESWPKRTPRYE